MAEYATWSDVEQGSDHEFSDAEIRQVETLLDRAEQLLLAKYDVAGAIEAELTTEAHVQTVLCNMVDRSLASPGPVRSETVGPVSTVYATSAAQTVAKFVLTRDDWLLLGVGTGSGLGTMTLDDPALPIVIQARLDSPHSSLYGLEQTN